MKRGIELEYWVIDEDGRLTTPGDVATQFDYIDREANSSLLELKTSPRDSADRLRHDLCERLDQLLDVLDAEGKRLAPISTPLTDVDLEIRAGPRINIQADVLGDSFEHVAACAGTHVHFEQTDPVTQLNLLTALDPAHCLVHSSSYYNGRRAGTCTRPFVYRRLGYAEYPDLGQLWPYIDTAAEWRRRVQRRYLDFRTAALEAGVDGSRIEHAFRPETAVWTPVRLRDDIDTVEWRAPDATLPSHVLRLVEDVTWLLETATDEGLLLDSSSPGVGTARIEVPGFDRVRTVTFDAMAHGLDSPAVRRYLSQLGFELSVYQPLGSRFDDGRWVTNERARERRRECANLLEQDLERLGRAGRQEESDVNDANLDPDRRTLTG